MTFARSESPRIFLSDSRDRVRIVMLPSRNRLIAADHRGPPPVRVVRERPIMTKILGVAPFSRCAICRLGFHRLISTHAAPAAFRRFMSVVPPSEPFSSGIPQVQSSTAPNLQPPNPVPVLVPENAGNASRDQVDVHRASDPEDGSDGRQRDVSWIWDVPFDRVDMNGAVTRIADQISRRQPGYVITANVHYAMLHHRQADVQEITSDASLILADGQPIVWRSKLTRAPLPTRVAGSELIHQLAAESAKRGWRIFFLGGAPGVARTCADRLTANHPGMNVAGVESPPFGPMSDADRDALIQRIRDSHADILLVAFGQPKGERWIHRHYEALGVPVSIQLGASFDFIAGTAKRAPVAFRKIGMEWAYRAATDPKRLIPRYTANASFLFGALLRDWQKKVNSWGMGVGGSSPRRESSQSL